MDMVADMSVEKRELTNGEQMNEKKGIEEDMNEDVVHTVEAVGMVHMFDSDDNDIKLSLTEEVDFVATLERDLNSEKKTSYESDHSINYAMTQPRKWYDLPSITTMTREMRFPNVLHPKHIRGQALTYKMPLFQQMREYACKKASFGLKRGVTIANENQFYISELVKRALLSHDNSRLTMSVLPLCFLPETCAEMLWKVGSTVLSSNPCLEKDRESFNKWMEKVCKHDHLPEVVMDRVSTMLSSHGNLQEAYEVATEAITQERMLNDVYFNIYYGSLEYSLWKLEKEKLANSKSHQQSRRNWGGDDEDEDDEVEEEDESSARGNPLVAFHGYRSMKYLARVEEERGTWDLVLPKYIDLVTFYEGRKGAVEALCKHLENNPNNPNSYEFYLHYIDESTTTDGLNRLHVLEDYCALDPTNEWGKELLTRYLKTGSYSECLTLLMTRLDHQACSNSFFDWHFLHMLLQMRHQVEDVQNFVDSHLSGSSWVRYHFPIPLDRGNYSLDDEVLKLKASIAQILNIGPYAECVDAWLSSKQISDPRVTDTETSSLPITINVSLTTSPIRPGEDDDFADISSPELLTSDDSDDDDKSVENVLAELIDRVVACEETDIPETTVEEDNDLESSFVELLPVSFHTHSQIQMTCECPNYREKSSNSVLIRGKRRKGRSRRWKHTKETKVSISKTDALECPENDACTKTKFPSKEFVSISLSSDEEENPKITNVDPQVKGGNLLTSYLDHVGVCSSGKRRWCSSSSSTTSAISSLSSDTDEEPCRIKKKPTGTTKRGGTSIRLGPNVELLDESQRTPNENIEPSTPHTVKLSSDTLKSVKKRLTNSLAAAGTEMPNTKQRKRQVCLKEDRASEPSSEPTRKRKKDHSDSDDGSRSSYLRTPAKKVLRPQNPGASTKSMKKKTLSQKRVNVRRRLRRVEGEQDYVPPKSSTKSSPSPTPERKVTRRTSARGAK